MPTSLPAEAARFYGVASGHVPGVYTDWADAQEQIKGWKLPKYKKFATRSEAEAFVQADGGDYRKSTVRPGQEDAAGDDIFDLAPAAKRLKGSLAVSSKASEKSSDAVLSTVTIPAAKQKLPTRISDTKSGPLRIYTDGSTLGNGKVGAVAGVGVFFGDGDPRYGPIIYKSDIDSCKLEPYLLTFKSSETFQNP
jgi:ribonuclease HI